MAKKVTVINPVSDKEKDKFAGKLRVCGYARVSTSHAEQKESYMAQVEYYTNIITQNPLWEFAGVYADEGISGTKVEKRDEFQEMIQECEAGTIDLILTKSITRFARNTAECILMIRKLKAVEVGVFFEKENINTLDSTSELMLSIYASIAQGESEDISTNVKWGIKKRFLNGTYIVSTPPYGYCHDRFKNLIPVESEAKVVRIIYEHYLNGNGTLLISKFLNDEGFTNRKGRQWEESAVRSILINPTYEGNTLRQQTFTESTFPFVRKKNNGQVDMYLQEDAHPAIVTHEEAESARNILEYREDILNTGEDTHNRYIFTSRIICEECGGMLKRQKLYHGKTYEKIAWGCKHHIADKESCPLKSIREDVIHQAFLDMWNKLYTNQGTVLEPLLRDLKKQAENRPDSEELIKLNIEIENLSKQSQILSQVMKEGYMDPAIFMEKNGYLMYRQTECQRRRTILERQQKRTKEIVRTEKIIALLKNEGYQETFSEKLFDLIIQEIRITVDHQIIFVLKNGLNLTEQERGDKYGMAYSSGI